MQKKVTICVIENRCSEFNYQHLIDFICIFGMFQDSSPTTCSFFTDVMMVRECTFPWYWGSSSWGVQQSGGPAGGGGGGGGCEGSSNCK